MTPRAVVGLALVLLLSAGCVRRSLTIRSNPPGATILVNDKKLGETPYTYDFLWYGWHRISLTKPGYEQLDDRALIKSPFYLWIPFDLMMELLPFPLHDRKELSYTLMPATPLPEPSPPVLDVPAETPPESSKDAPTGQDAAAPAPEPG